MLLGASEALICGHVAAELAAGVGDESRLELWSRLDGLPWAGLDREGWLRAAEVKRELDRLGRRVALTDIAIAVTGARAGATVWALDADFDRIAAAMPELRLDR